jgi:hypothetical protein
MSGVAPPSRYDAYPGDSSISTSDQTSASPGKEDIFVASDVYKELTFLFQVVSHTLGKGIPYFVSC